MKKLLFQGLGIVVLFFSILFLLNRVDWVQLFKIEEATDQTEKKVGELFWDLYKESAKESKNTLAIQAVDTIVTKICANNNIDREKVKVSVIQDDEINAFALPNGHLIINTGLIENTNHQDELSGVIAHEIAHIELNHVMKKLGKEVGLSVLISMTGGSVATETIKEAIKMLSSSAFDRGMEKDADIKAVDYLFQSNVNTESFANFLYRLSEEEGAASKYFTWISTHPDSKDRAAYILEYSKGKSFEKKSLLSDETWKKLKESIKE